MNWKDYEKEVHVYFSEMYPNATITYDAKIIGRYSKVKRQIDVLIEDDVAGFPMRLIVDAKFYSQKIDVKGVETFISMLEDVEANQGLLVTKKGYSDGAIKRAYNGPQQLELDILNFDDLLNHQGLEAIPYSGKYALVLSSPFGWVIDYRKNENFLASLYQRGINLDEAQKRQEWVYFNFWHKDKQATNIQELVAMQNSHMESFYSNVQLKEVRAPNRKDGIETFIRIVQFDNTKPIEITGFMDCGDFIVFFVLFTSKELQGKNLRKLAHLLKYSTPLEINFNNTKVIQQLESELIEIKDSIKRAEACNQLAKWYLEMDNEREAIRYRRLCWEANSEYYENIIPLIRGELKLNNWEEAIKYSLAFFDMEPTNPRIMQDLLSVYEDAKNGEWFEGVIEKLKEKYDKDNEALANISVHYAQYLETIMSMEKSIEHYELALELFKEVDENHNVIQQIKALLKRLYKAVKGVS